MMACGPSVALQLHDGVVIVIAWESGQVSDYEIKSKRCIVCARQKMDPESECSAWLEGHQKH